MTTPADITDTIVSTAQGPASAANKTESATAHNPKDLIDVDKYLRDRAAADAAAQEGNPFFQIRGVQLELPGGCR